MANDKLISETGEDAIEDLVSTNKKPVIRKVKAKRTTSVVKETNSKSNPKSAVKPIQEGEPTTEQVSSEMLADSTIEKVLKTGKKTGRIVSQAGGVILGSSVQATKIIAGMYLKAGKKVVKSGKNLFVDTTKIIVNNQKNVADVSKTAIKETIEILKEANLVENPLKKKRK